MLVCVYGVNEWRPVHVRGDLICCHGNRAAYQNVLDIYCVSYQNEKVETDLLSQTRSVYQNEFKRSHYVQTDLFY